MQLYRLKITLDSLPNSLNVKLRSHHLRNHRENKSWDTIIELASCRAKPPKPLERARISITRHAHRMLDYDGLVGSLKPVVDALVTAQLIKDDAWSVIGAWQVDQVYRPKSEGPLLTVLIEELDPYPN